jgi:single-strand DNA-binding protein
MAGETTVTVVGNLARDPEIRFLPNGTGMCKFSVASTPRMQDGNGGWKDGEALFLECTAWRGLAENIAESLNKGARVIVTGRLRQSRWEDKTTGEKKSMIQLDVDDVAPSLKWATARVNKTVRSKAGDGFVPADAPDDAWATATPTPAGTPATSREAA